MISKPTMYVAGAGVALVGSFLIFRQWEKYKARKAFEALRQKAIAGEITAEDFSKISTLLAPKASDKVFLLSNTRPTCSALFSFSPELIARIPGMTQERARAAADGDCIDTGPFVPGLPACRFFEDPSDGTCV